MMRSVSDLNNTSTCINGSADFVITRDFGINCTPVRSVTITNL